VKKINNVIIPVPKRFSILCYTVFNNYSSQFMTKLEQKTNRNVCTFSNNDLKLWDRVRCRLLQQMLLYRGPSVRPSACLSHSCTLAKPLDGMIYQRHWTLPSIYCIYTGPVLCVKWRYGIRAPVKFFLLQIAANLLQIVE